MEENETPTHVMLECTGVTEQREIYLGSPATIPEVLSNLGGMLGFWNELGWLEWRATMGNFTYNKRSAYVRKLPREKKKKKNNFIGNPSYTYAMRYVSNGHRTGLEAPRHAQPSAIPAAIARRAPMFSLLTKN
ncbi:jg20171 [Pararge aegeria aegeria]|uniref:Jg20171 protein n=1 Tax=Pararge aegeria aegeria TaxID=348720 RepID=A0A8S4RYJ2_9NEOP|nr:jg20171 [Pararge aegeria aegeria]